MERVRGSAASTIDLDFHLGLPSASPRPPPSSAQPMSGGSMPSPLLDLCAPRNQEGVPGGPAAVAPRLSLPPASPRASSAGAPGSSALPKSSCTAVIVFGVDLALFKSEGPTSVDVGTPTNPRNQDAEPPSKRVRTDSSAADAAPPRLNPILAAQFPQASRRPRRSRVDPSWVRAEILPRHGLPTDLLLHYVGEKVLHKSDIGPSQARFLFPSGTSCRFRAFLSADEMTACGFDCTDKRAKSEKNGKRAKPTPYPGIPVSVYVSGAAQSGVSELRLNKFHRTDGTVINGRGYCKFIGQCGLVKGDGVELWAFRRPEDRRLCFLIAKRDDVCPLY